MERERNSLHLEHPSVVQTFAFCHANSISMNWEKQDQWVGDVKVMPWWGVVRQDGVKHKPTFPYEMMLSFPFTVWFVLLPCKYLKIKWKARPVKDVPLNSICHCHTEYRRKGLVSTYRLGKGRQEVDVTVKPEACGSDLSQIVTVSVPWIILFCET